MTALPWTALFVLALIFYACGKKYPSPEGMDAERGFQAVALPVLRDQCQGCHFAGGVMYRDFPFDDRGVVQDRGDELLLQLKGNGKERMAEWLALARREAELTPHPGNTSGNP